MKKCTVCGIWKEEEEFYRKGAGSDKRRADCKECRRKYFRAFDKTPAGKAVRRKQAERLRKIYKRKGDNLELSDQYRGTEWWFQQQKRIEEKAKAYELNIKNGTENPL